MNDTESTRSPVCVATRLTSDMCLTLLIGPKKRMVETVVNGGNRLLRLSGAMEAGVGKHKGQ